jgi:hypothetical protein
VLPHKTEFEFQKRHNIYLSRNTFSTQLPSHYFLDWIEMKTSALLKASSSAEVLQPHHTPQVIGSFNIPRGKIPSILRSLNRWIFLKTISQDSREIPQQLLQPNNFLAIFNVSRNHLTGPIPRGKQFDTFLNDS